MKQFGIGIESSEHMSECISIFSVYLHFYRPHQYMEYINQYMEYINAIPLKYVQSTPEQGFHRVDYNLKSLRLFNHPFAINVHILSAYTWEEK
jgi:hypothetical protein